MDIYRELEPIIWSCISGVPTNKIKHGDSMTNDEKVRLEEAIGISKQTNFFLLEESNYSFTLINQAIENYKNDYNICAAYLDYLELTPAITQEYSKLMKGMGAVREDQILLEASSRFKDMAKDYDIDFTCLTQVSDNFRTLKFYDQRAIKGGHSVTNKADLGIVEFIPDKKQLELIEPVVRGVARGLNKIIMPNIGKAVYKNRGDEYKDVIVWGYQNLGNGEYRDICVTNKYYEPIDVPKQFITVVEEDGNNE